MRRATLERFARLVALGVYLFLVTSLLLFTALEVPSVADALAPDLPYYAIRREYDLDTTLVFTPSHAGAPHRKRYRFFGDLYHEGYGSDVAPMDVDVTYSASGFRTNSSAPPFEVAVFGDSYVELSENDRNTFSELLRDATGRSVINLGRSWYGPDQYVELLRRYGPEIRPRYALFMFYSGNDIDDIRQYGQWQREGRYYGQNIRFWEGSFPRRYLLVLSQAATKIRNTTMFRLYVLKARLTGVEIDHRRNLTFVRVGGDTVPMIMGPLSPEVSGVGLLASDEWKTLGELAGSFGRLSRSIGTRPMVVYLPTKVQTYAHLIDPVRSGLLSGRVEPQQIFVAAQAEALAEVAAEHDLCYLDLLPRFQALAAAGELLYHPFDTHWNERGRRAAAAAVADALDRGACDISPTP